MSFLDIFMHLRHLHDIADIVWANKAEGISWALKGST